MESSKGFFVAHMKAAGAPPNIALKSSLFPDRDVVGVVWQHLSLEGLTTTWGKLAIFGFLPCPYMGGFLKCWYPTTMGFPTKNDHHLGWRLGVPPFKETPIFSNFFFWMGKSHGLWFSSLWFTLTSKKNSQQDVRPSHPSSKSLKAVTHMGRCHLKPPRMSELTAQLLRFCCWKKTWMGFFKRGVKPLITRLPNKRSWY